MEKTLWAGIVLLWLCLIGSAAIGAERPPQNPSHIMSNEIAVGAAVSVSSAVPLVTSVRSPISDVGSRPAVDLGARGGAEFAGTIVAGVWLLWVAGRRRIL